MSDDRQFLPAGVPLPEREVIARLRQSISQHLKTPHPPLDAELAVLIVADELGVDLSAVDARSVWLQAPDERAELFTTLSRLLSESL